MWPFKSKSERPPSDLAKPEAELTAKVLKYHPHAVAAADIVSDIERRIADNPSFRYGYECLFIAAQSTRPSMEFSLYERDLNSPEWRSRVIETVRSAERSAAPGEAVYFDPD